MTHMSTKNLGGASAWILHRPHPSVQGLIRQLGVIGLDLREAWPELPAEAIGADFVFYDADMGHDEQFPWAPGKSPMPMIAKTVGAIGTFRNSPLVTPDSTMFLHIP